MTMTTNSEMTVILSFGTFCVQNLSGQILCCINKTSGEVIAVMQFSTRSQAETFTNWNAINAASKDCSNNEILDFCNI